MSLEQGQTLLLIQVMSVNNQRGETAIFPESRCEIQLSSK